MKVRFQRRKRLNGRFYRQGEEAEIEDGQAEVLINSYVAEPVVVSQSHVNPEEIPAVSPVSPATTPQESQMVGISSLPLYVVIPTYNRAHHLRDTFGSVLEARRRCPDDTVHIIIVDDGSTDDTGALLQEFGKGRGGWVRTVSLPERFRDPRVPSGAAKARNAGTRLVPNEAIVVELDDHDILESDALQAIQNAFADPDVWLVWGSCNRMRDNGEMVDTYKKPPYTPGQLRLEDCYCEGVRAYRKRLFGAVGGYREDEIPAADYGVFLRAELWLGDKGLMRLPAVLSTIRVEGDSLSIRWKARQKEKAQELQARALRGELDIPTQPRKRKARVRMTGALSEKISIIIPHFGSPEYLQHTVASLVAATNIEDCEIIIVDNGSYEQCAEVYTVHGDRIKLIRNEYNRGWVGGINQGLSEASGGYILIANDDLIFPSDFGEQLKQMVQRMKANPEIATISPCRTDGGTDSTLWRIVEKGKVSELAPFKERFELGTVAEVDGINGQIREAIEGERWHPVSTDVVLFCVLCRADVLHDLGGLCEIYGIGYVDDVDLTRRLNSLGYRHEVALHCFVYHACNKTFKSSDLMPHGIFDLYRERNRSIYQELWGNTDSELIPCLYLTWNRLEYTKQSLPPLLAQAERENLLVVAIDNASEDGTQAYLKTMEQDYPRHLRVVLNTENRMVAGGMNQFIRMVSRPDGECAFPWLAKVDNDTILHDGWAEELIGLAKDHQLDVVQFAHGTFGDDATETEKTESPIRRGTHVGGSGIVIRSAVLKNKPVKELGLVRGWTGYQKDYELKTAIAIRKQLTLLDRTESGETNADYPEYTKTIWTDRTGNQQKIVAGIRTYNNAEAYIGEVLEHLSVVADKIVVLDDASEDGTEKICRAFRKVEWHQNEQNVQRTNERPNRETLYRLVAQHRPDWILWTDSDEMFEPEFTRQIYKLVNAQCPAYTFDILHLWDGYDQYRVDGKWGGYRNVRMFRHLPKVEWKLLDGHHCGTVPAFYRQHAMYSGLAILHLAYARKRDQCEHFLKHIQWDETGRSGGHDHIKSILADDVVLDAWPKGLPVRIKKKSFTRFCYDWREGKQLFSDSPKSFCIDGTAQTLPVEVVIPHWGEPDKLYHTLRTLFVGLGDYKASVTVIDNGPDDDAHDKAALYSDQESTVGHTFNVVRNEHNRGWIGGVNQGVAATDKPYVLICNDDLIFPPTFGAQLAEMVQRLDTCPRCAAISPTRIEGGSPASLGMLGEKYSLCGDLRRQHADFAQYDLTRAEDAARGIAAALREKHSGQQRRIDELVLFCALVRKSAFDGVGGLRELYGVGVADDTDLTQKLLAADYWVEVKLDSFVFHWHHSTFRGGELMPDFSPYHKLNHQMYCQLWPTDEKQIAAYQKVYGEDPLATTLRIRQGILPREGAVTVAIWNPEDPGPSPHALRKCEAEHPDTFRVVVNDVARDKAEQFAAMVRRRDGTSPFSLDAGEMDMEIDVRPRVIACLRVYNDADKYLRPVIEHLHQLADRVIVLDDASIDSTPEICKAFDYVEYHRNETNVQSRGEPENRIRLYRTIRKHNPEWVLWWDSDEFLEPEGVEHFADLLDTEAPAIRFPIRHFWNGLDAYRVDGRWGGTKNIRLFRFDPDFDPEIDGELYHSCPIITHYSDVATDSPYVILHTAYARERDRVQHFLRHYAWDSRDEKNRKRLAHDLTIFDDEPQLERWDQGFPVPIVDVGFETLQLDWSVGAKADLLHLS